MILGESQQQFASPGEALAHHGVKGMKWGVRKEEPTGGKDGKVGVDPITAAIGAFYIGIFLAGTIATIRDIRARAKDSGKHYQKQNANVAWRKKPELAKKAPPMTVDSLQNYVVKPVNPNYPKPGTKMNCRRATMTYEMRRRGYDVTATPSHYATGQHLQGFRTATMTQKKRYESIWGEKEVKGDKPFYKESPDRRSQLIFDSLKQYPNGARGELGVGWSFGGGHSMAFEIVNNKPVIFDTQSATIFREPASFSKFAATTHSAATTRTDNIQLNDQFLRRWMVNAA